MKHLQQFTGFCLAMLLLLLALLASVAWAQSCRTHTVTLPDGRFMICQTCCYSGQCSTNCW